MELIEERNRSLSSWGWGLNYDWFCWAYSVELGVGEPHHRTLMWRHHFGDEPMEVSVYWRTYWSRSQLRLVWGDFVDQLLLERCVGTFYWMEEELTSLIRAHTGEEC